jgi:type II secretory pathway pseudopilin PulG
MRPGKKQHRVPVPGLVPSTATAVTTAAATAAQPPSNLTTTWSLHNVPKPGRIAHIVSARQQTGRHAPQRGFTYVVVLAMILLLSLGLAAMGPSWARESQRERERELLRIGLLYATAIHQYHQVSPGSVKQYPPTLEALLDDRRMVGTYRHLRRLYPDPLDPASPWGVLRAPDGGIRGVFSRSRGVPLRTVPLDLGLLTLPAARSYGEWTFSPDTTPRPTPTP